MYRLLFLNALHYAIANNDNALITVLLSYKADANATYNGGNSALSLAFDKKDLTLVDQLLKHGGKLDAGALLSAAKNNFWEFIKTHIDKTSPCDRLINVYGELLHEAICQNNEAMTVYLLENQADANTIKNNKSPLKLAFEKNNKPLIDVLLKHNAKLDAETIKYAAKYRYWNLVKSTIENTPSDQQDLNLYGELLHESVEQGNIEATNYLLQKNANLTIIQNNKTIFQRAVDKKQRELFELIVKQYEGFDKDYVNAALCSNARYLDWHFVEFLITNTPEKHRDHKVYGDLLFTAIAQNNNAAVALLSKYNADRTVRNNKDRTPIQVAMDEKRKNLIDILANYQTDRQDNVRYGRVLLRAAKKGWFDTATTLLEKSYAPIDKYDRGDKYKGYTALHFAVDKNNAKFAGALLKHGADPKAQYENQQSAMQLAKTLARNEILFLFSCNVTSNPTTITPDPTKMIRVSC